MSAVEAVHREVDITSGELLPALFPELATALAGGGMSLSGFLACTTPLQKAKRLGTADRLAAEAVLARFAMGCPLDGENPDASEAAPVPTTDELAGLAAYIVARLDPDGAEPVDRAAKRKRHFTIGKLREGTVPVRGELLPEVAAQLQKLLDSLMNPKADDGPLPGGTVQFRPSEDGSATRSDRNDGTLDHVAQSPPEQSADLRNHAQRRHDAFATIIMVAAASGGMPQLGGAAPTLVVSVSAKDFLDRTGRATIEGMDFDVPLTQHALARWSACCSMIMERSSRLPPRRGCSPRISGGRSCSAIENV